MGIMKFNYLIEILLFFSQLSHIYLRYVSCLLYVSRNFLFLHCYLLTFITMAAMYEIIQEWKSACSVPETGSTTNY